MSDPYLQTIASNLAHLRSIIPPQPKRNLASNSSTLPMSEDDPSLARQIKWNTIGDGRAGTRQTMNVMAEVARQAATDPTFVKFARQFSGLDELESWMREHFTYRDEHEELIRTPVFMLQDRGRTSGNRVVGLEGDCDDASTFLAAAARVLGYPARLVAIRYNQSNLDFEHVFAQACRNGEWVTLDPTVDVGTTIQSVEDMIVPV